MNQTKIQKIESEIKEIFFSNFEKDSTEIRTPVVDGKIHFVLEVKVHGGHGDEAEAMSHNSFFMGGHSIEDMLKLCDKYNLRFNSISSSALSQRSISKGRAVNLHTFEILLIEKKGEA